MRAAPLSLTPSLPPPSPVLDLSDNFLFVCICARKPRVKRVKVPKTKRKLAVCARAQRVERKGRDTAQPRTHTHTHAERGSCCHISLDSPRKTLCCHGRRQAARYPLCNFWFNEAALARTCLLPPRPLTHSHSPLTPTCPALSCPVPPCKRQRF